MDPEELMWFESLTPVDDKVIAEVERELGVLFPSDYRSFVRRFHGGRPVQTDFPLKDPRKSTAGVGVFMSMQPERGSDYILSAVELLSDRLPRDVIPIAIGPGGDYVCLDFRRAIPAVVYWHHERAGLPGEFTFVAKSFGDFLSLLYEPDITEESKLD